MKNLDTGLLSHEQARHYRRLGYYRLDEVYDGDDVAEMRSFVQTEVKGESFARADRLGAKVKKMYGLYDRDPELMHRVLTNPTLSGTLVSLLGPNVVFLKNRHNHATVNDVQGAAAEGLHRDILQPTRGILTASIYLDDATHRNGATRILPGSDELPFVGVPEENGGGVWMADHSEYDGLEEQALQVPVSAGGVLLFNSLNFHGVGANPSGDPRISMTLAFRAADELDRCPDSETQLVVAGEHFYIGNDR